MKYLIIPILISIIFLSCDSEFASPSNASVGGSLARFAVMNETLVTINQGDLNLYTIELNGALSLRKTLFVGQGLETLFPRGDLLFIGTRVGMYIYRKNAAELEFLSFVDHLESCDPVVANETHAYTTLRSGRSCTNGSNLLDVYDIGDLENPKLIQTISMKGPKGLGLTDTHLYVCDGENGFIIYDILTDGTVSEQSNVTGFNAHDVIVIGKLLIVVASDNIYQYNILDDGEVERISNIELS